MQDETSFLLQKESVCHWKKPPITITGKILLKGKKILVRAKTSCHNNKLSVTGKTFGFKDVESYMENNIGKGSYKNVIDDIKTKTFLSTTFAEVNKKPLSLRYILNETLIPGWTKTNKMQNVFQIHHPFGFARNPFVTQLSFFDDNRKEYYQKSKFFKKLKNEKTLSGKKKLVTNFLVDLKIKV